MSSKIGEAHSVAMFRVGLKELRNAFDATRESASGTELGTVGTQTQGEIAKARCEAGALVFIPEGESHGTLSCVFQSNRTATALVG
jgi:glutamate 5-kinase